MSEVGQVSTRDLINAHFEELEVEDVYLIDPQFCDKAIVGYTDTQVIYSYDKLIGAYTTNFMESENIPQEEALDMAIDWVSYNTIRSLDYMTGNKPIIMYEIDYI